MARRAFNRHHYAQVESPRRLYAQTNHPGFDSWGGGFRNFFFGFLFSPYYCCPAFLFFGYKRVKRVQLSRCIKRSRGFLRFFGWVWLWGRVVGVTSDVWRWGVCHFRDYTFLHPRLAHTPKEREAFAW